MKGRTLKYISPKDVDLGKRFRETFGDLVELANDIKERGVLQSITVVDKQEIEPELLDDLGAYDDTKPYLLMAGERRTRAAIMAKVDKIPAQIFDHIPDELELRIVELHENLLRKDMGFNEVAKARARILELMQAKFGEKTSTAEDADGVSLRDVANEIGVSASTLSQDRKLADAMKDHPEIEEAETREAALRMVDEIWKREAAQELAKRHAARKPKSTEEVDRKRIADNYKLGNFFEGIAQIGDDAFDFAEIDPPYAIDLKAVKREGDTTEYNEIDEGFYPGFMQQTFNETYRVLAPHSWMICWFAPDPWFAPLAEWIVSAGKPDDMSLEEWIDSKRGFQMRAMPAVWIKRTGQTNWPSRYLASACEWFFYARKGDPGFHKPGHINVFDYSPVASQKKRHPTERPIEMIQDIIQTFMRPNKRILVPFAGSGNTLLAAANLEMPAMGWDLTEKYKQRFDIEAMTGPFRKWRSY